MAELPAGVTMVTAWDRGGRPAGATVSAVSSLSLDPPLLLVCLATTSETLAALRATRSFLVHVLAEGQEELAARYATKSPAKFDGVMWAPGALGLPRLAGCTVLVACRVSRLVSGGDHVIVLGEIRELEIARGVHPLVYHRRRMASAVQLWK